jgi:hypothetical protein
MSYLVGKGEHERLAEDMATINSMRRFGKIIQVIILHAHIARARRMENKHVTPLPEDNRVQMLCNSTSRAFGKNAVQ